MKAAGHHVRGQCTVHRHEMSRKGESRERKQTGGSQGSGLGKERRATLGTGFLGGNGDRLTADGDNGYTIL